MTIDTKDVVSWMKDLRDARVELEVAEERGREYLRQCKADVEADLDTLRARVNKLTEILTLFIEDENGGEKYNVPGIGTAYMTTRRTPKIVDEEAFVGHLQNTHPLLLERLYKKTLSASEAKKHIQAALEDGEVLPGTDVEEKTSLSVRLTA